MAGIAKAIRDIRTHIPANVTLVCVSKFQPVEAIREAYEAGERHFGESRVQELQRKRPVLPEDICWHFIGHLQTNKVRDLLKQRPYLIQSVDSEHLLKAIDEEAAKQSIVQNILLEVHVAQEETKTGFSPDELIALCPRLAAFHNIHVAGLMCMATNTDDIAEIRRCFEAAKALLDRMNTQCHTRMTQLSMGMSDDFTIAIECGSTMVRIGSSIFGERIYSPKRPPLPKAVFFDQDGVLFDSMPNHAKAWVMAMQDHGLPFSAMQTYLNEGRTGAAVIQEAHLRVYGTDASQEVIDAIYEAKSNYFIQLTGGRLPELIPGVMDVLRFLKEQGVQCWVVTGSGQRSLFNRIHDTFPGIFTGIITAFDVTHGKPDPEPYLKAWERCGFKKEECFVVENAPLGVRAGKGAGLFTIAVNTGILPDSALAAEHADLICPDMFALLKWFNS